MSDNLNRIYSTENAGLIPAHKVKIIERYKATPNWLDLLIDPQHETEIRTLRGITARESGNMFNSNGRF